jgi:hypothetical protein
MAAGDQAALFLADSMYSRICFIELSLMTGPM